VRVLMPSWISRADRRAVQIEASVHRSGLQLPVTIIDMSLGGCKIRCLHVLPIGEVVQLEIPAFLPNLASVRWSLPGIAGLRFI
jgi:hypothetical protein